MSTIIEVHAREILDSRGNPTVETDVVLSSGASGRAAVPSGASTGEHEAVELRDGDAKRYVGKGVAEAVRNVNEVLGPRARGNAGRRPDRDRRRDDGRRRHAQQEQARRQRDSRACRSRWPAPPRRTAGCPLYRYLGGPMARVLPVPMMNILNGGAHASNNVDAQEFMVVPDRRGRLSRSAAHGRRGLPRAEEGAEQDGSVHRGGRRGRLRADLPSNEAALDVVMQAIQAAGYEPGQRHRHRARRGRVGAVPGRRVRLQEGRREPAHAPRRWSTSMPAGSTAIRSSRSRTVSPRTTGTAGRCSPSGCTTGCSWWATTSSSPTSIGWAGASRKASATPCWSR